MAFWNRSHHCLWFVFWKTNFYSLLLFIVITNHSLTKPVSILATPLNELLFIKMVRLGDTRPHSNSLSGTPVSSAEKQVVFTNGNLAHSTSNQGKIIRGLCCCYKECAPTHCNLIWVYLVWKLEVLLYWVNIFSKFLSSIVMVCLSWFSPPG